MQNSMIESEILYMKKVIVKGQELYSNGVELKTKEELKEEVIGDFAAAFVQEVNKLIEKMGKDEVMKLCKRK